jgi:hypothetical protein
MRILNRFALAAVAVLVLAAALTPAQAACGGNPVIQTFAGPYGTSFIWTQNIFAPGYYPGYPPFGNYYTKPWTPAFEATFWALGTGDPAVGPGDDAGTWTVPPWPWAYYNPTYYGYYYYAGSIFAGWGANAGIDGCLQNNPPGTCTCVLLTDEDGTDGYFAITGNNASAGLWWTQLDQPGFDGAGNAAPIILWPMPRPVILNSVRQATTLDLCLTVTYPGSPPADHTLGTCGGSGACGPIGFQVVQMILPRGAVPPATRQAPAWTIMTLCDGSPQPITPIGATVDVLSPCGATNSDVYLAILLYFDNIPPHFTSPVVSGNSVRIECGPQLAEPEEPRRFRPGSQQQTRRPARERSR